MILVSLVVGHAILSTATTSAEAHTMLLPVPDGYRQELDSLTRVTTEGAVLMPENSPIIDGDWDWPEHEMDAVLMRYVATAWDSPEDGDEWQPT